MLYLSSIAARKKHFNQIWPRSEKEYDPQVIRKFLGEKLNESFPHPCTITGSLENGMHIFFLTHPISEAENYQFFGNCHQYLHEPNPYKKSFQAREAECPAVLADAGDKLNEIWNLLKVHYRATQLDDGESAGILCKMGEDEEGNITIMSMVAG